VRFQAAAVLVCACLVGCTASPTPTASSSATPNLVNSSPSLATASPTATPPAPQLPGPVDHVFLVIYENHAYEQIVGASAAPYINGLIANGALATNYHGVAHPSLPNYLALFAGTTFGVTSDCDPTARGCHFAAASLPDRIEAAGLTWSAYFDHMPSPCTAEDAGGYRVHHDPFLYFDPIAKDPGRCAAHVLPLARLATDLLNPATTPNLAVIVPGNDHNMHDGSIRTGDTWLRDTLAPILDSPAWAAGRSLIVFTFDEDDGSTANRVVTLFFGPAARIGHRSGVAYTHYSLLRTLEDWLGVAPLTANDRAARPMSDLIH
jgi:phosphatidylinositol-3-phosphatase